MYFNSLAIIVSAATMAAALQLNMYSDTECKNFIGSEAPGVGGSHNVPVTFYGFRGVGMKESSSFMVTNDGNCRTDNGKYYTGTGGDTGTTDCSGYDGGFNCYALEFQCQGTTCD